MLDWTSTGRLTYLIGFPMLITVTMYASALFGVKWQGAWVQSSVYNYIKKTPRYLQLLVASLTGAITPFCSCTTIPGFAAILEAGLGLGTAMTFLIASPTVDPASIILLLVLFGPRLTVLYVVGCLVISIAVGWIFGRSFSEKEVNPALLFSCEAELGPTSWAQAAKTANTYIARFWWVIILSTLLGFVLYDYVPAEWLAKLSTLGGGLAIPLASVLGVFVYAHMTVLVPVGAALLSKGMAPGIVIAFLASSAGISLPEIFLLRKIVSLRLTSYYILSTVASIALLGFVVNLVGW